jgi:aerobic-type carbon monoxide dehydrogenase small subunit (CoxS/CutS family)
MLEAIPTGSRTMDSTTLVCRLSVNGDVREAAVTPFTTLLEALRYGLGLTGSKQGCDKGDCGACTVVVNGEAILACISLAMAYHDGPAITTIEGLARDGAPHPLQDSLDVTGGAQCGFCTPGILMSAWALLERNTSPTRDEIARALSGNLCRCTGYTKIFEAVELAATRLRERRSGTGGATARASGAAQSAAAERA